MAKRPIPTDLITITDVLALTGLSESGFRWLRKRKNAPRGYRQGKRVLFSRERIVRWQADRTRVSA